MLGFGRFSGGIGFRMELDAFVLLLACMELPLAMSCCAEDASVLVAGAPYNYIYISTYTCIVKRYICIDDMYMYMHPAACANAYSTYARTSTC